MERKYSQWKAMFAITRASLRGITRSPSTMMFSLFFPIVLITIFGSINGGGSPSVDVALAKNSDTTNELYKRMKYSGMLNFVKGDTAELNDKLKKGRITAFIDIQKQDDTSGSQPTYKIHLKTSSASQQDMPILNGVLENVVAKTDDSLNPGRKTIAMVTREQVEGRSYGRIDFLLPGMLGFSLIGAAVFGVAFVFFSLRETLVLKRMFSTPIKKMYIVLGESLARIIFQMFTAIVLIAFGTIVYGFTLSNGWLTFAEMLVVCFLGLVVFMGFGFLISSIAKNQNVIPLYANLFMFPQYFLSGTFFSRTVLPDSIQPIIKFLPLTALNDALRKISFEGVHLTGCWPQLAVLLVWGVVIYAITIRIFKWE